MSALRRRQPEWQTSTETLLQADKSQKATYVNLLWPGADVTSLAQSAPFFSTYVGCPVPSRPLTRPVDTVCSQQKCNYRILHSRLKKLTRDTDACGTEKAKLPLGEIRR